MNIENLIESFSEFKEVKNINRETMMNILEDVFKSVLAKKYEEADNFDVIINVDKGDLEIWRNREVVKNGKVENPVTQISLSAALKIAYYFRRNNFWRCSRIVYFYTYNWVLDILRQLSYWQLKEKI